MKNRIRTLEVLDIILKEKSMSTQHERSITDALKSLALYSDEYPDNAGVINAWTTALKKEGRYADTTIKLWFVVAKSAGKYLEDTHDVKPNPFEKAKTPAVVEKSRRAYTPNEMAQILASCREGYDRELILTLIDSTCRVGALSGMKGRDIDADEGFINVYSKGKYQRYRLDKRVCLALKQLAGSDEGYVFKDKFGNMASRNCLVQRVRKIIIRAGITGDKLGAHSIRHGDGTLIARFRRSALDVKALLRHKNINTSMIYIHEIDDEIQREISPLELLGEAIDKQNGNKPGGGKGFIPRQVTMGEGQGMTTDMVLAEPEIVEGQPDLANDLFPEIADCASVRPLLKTDDLQMLRRIFVSYYRMGGNHDDMIKARQLLRRMLRRT